MAASVFDARQAKRLFPLCTGAAIAGSFVGTLLSGPAARALGTPSLVVIEAVLLTVVGLLVVAVSRTTTVRVPPRRRGGSIVAELRTGFDSVIGSPLMRLVAVAYVLLAILGSSVTYPFLQVASTTFTTEADLATALGLLSASVTATSFVVSLLVANRVYARFGVAGAALILPLVYLGGFGIWIVAFSMTTAALFRFTQQTAQRGLSNAAWSAFYNVVPSERRAQVLAFNDGVPGQIGTILSGLLLIAAGSVLARDQVFWLGAVTAIACTLVVVGIRRRYGTSLLRTLRAGLGEQVLEGGPGLAALTRDPAIAVALIQALGAPEPGVRRMAASLLGGTESPDAPAALAGVLADPDPGVRVAALDAIAALGGDAAVVDAVRDRLSDADPTVRAAAVRTLTAIAVLADDPAGAIPAVTGLAADDSPAVRAAVASSMLAGGHDDASVRVIEELLDDPDVACRIAGLDAIRRLGDPILLERVHPLLADPAFGVRVAALDALATARDPGATVPQIIASLDDPVADVRVAAARILAAFETAPPGVVGGPGHRFGASPGRRADRPGRARPGGAPAGRRVGGRAAHPGQRPPTGAPRARRRRGHARDRVPRGDPRAPRARPCQPRPGRAGRARGTGGRWRDPPLSAVAGHGDPGAGHRSPRIDRRAASERRSDRAARGGPRRAAGSR